MSGPCRTRMRSSWPRKTPRGARPDSSEASRRRRRRSRRRSEPDRRVSAARREQPKVTVYCRGAPAAQPLSIGRRASNRGGPVRFIERGEDEVPCCCGFSSAVDAQFTRKKALKELAPYRKRGPEVTTKLLRDALVTARLTTGRTLLDIRTGIGMLTFELLDRGGLSAALLMHRRRT
jgi:hypothetical protein